MVQDTYPQPPIPNPIPLIPRLRPLPTLIPLHRWSILMFHMKTLVWPSLRRTCRLDVHVLERALQVMLIGSKVAETVAVVGDFSIAPGAECSDEVAVPGAADKGDEGRGLEFGFDHAQGELGAFAPCFFPFGVEVDGAGEEMVGWEEA
jgi:hypothetical protein